MNLPDQGNRIISDPKRDGSVIQTINNETVAHKSINDDVPSASMSKESNHP